MREHFEWYTIEAVEPKVPGARWQPKEVTRVVSPTYKGLWPEVQRWQATIPRAEWPEGHGVIRVRGGVRKKMPGKWTVYFHGPLGWMAKGYVDGCTAHDNRCKKCNRIRETLTALYPWSEEIRAGVCQHKRLPSKGRWEHLEAMAADVPHVDIFSMKWALRGLKL